MGSELMKFYKYIGDEAGMKGKMQLAQLTKVPVTLAATAPDSEDNLAKFRAAIAEITGKPAPAL